MAGFAEGDLDYVLVPSGVAVLLAYQLYFVYMYRRSPTATVVGMENEDKKAWVDSILQVTVSSRTYGSGVVGSNITVATFLSSVSLTLCSLLGAWLTNSDENPIEGLVYGNQKVSTVQVKLLCLLICFVVAFSFFLESARQFVQASFLVTTAEVGQSKAEYTKAVVVRGGLYFSAGLRALYFALALLLWFFGPIPMFVGSVILAIVLYFHDTKVVSPQRRRLSQKAGSTSDTTDVSKTNVASSVGQGK